MPPHELVYQLESQSNLLPKCVTTRLARLMHRDQFKNTLVLSWKFKVNELNSREVIYTRERERGDYEGDPVRRRCIYQETNQQVQAQSDVPQSSQPRVGPLSFFLPFPPPSYIYIAKAPATSFYSFLCVRERLKVMKEKIYIYIYYVYVRGGWW